MSATPKTRVGPVSPSPNRLQQSARNSSTAKTSATPQGVSSRTSSTSGLQSPSPTKNEAKKVPPIKAPVGLAKGPDLKNVRSKIGSLDNVKHRPAGGEKKVETQKLEWNVKSRVGSLDNASHKPLGGDVKVKTQKLDWKVKSKIGSLDNVKHQPGGGAIKIFDEKYARNSKSPTSTTPTTPTPGSKSGSFSNGKATIDGASESPSPNPANQSGGDKSNATSNSSSAPPSAGPTGQNPAAAKNGQVNSAPMRSQVVQ